MTVLTVYNHGTTVDSTCAPHTITKLSQNTSSDHLVTQGVGSEGKEGKGLKHALARAAGSMFGTGTDDNVAEAVNWIMYKWTHGARASVINLVGFSRGAVACFKQANWLWRKAAAHGHKGLEFVPVRIFAIDPVPGCGGQPNAHMYKHIELSPNMAEVRIVVAEHERRATFRPAIDEAILSQPSATHSYITIPGNHAGIVMDTAVQNDSAKIVRAAAKKFLQKSKSVKPGQQLTTFQDASYLMDGDEILGRYAKIMLTFDDYYHMGNRLAATPGPTKHQPGPVENVLSSPTFDEGRQIQTQKANANVLTRTLGGEHEQWKTGKTIGLKRFGHPTRFFANEDHKKHFRKKYPGDSAVLEQLEVLGQSPQQNAQMIDLLARRLNLVGGFDKWGMKINEHIQAFKRIVTGG